MASFPVRFVADTGQTLSAFPLQNAAGAAVSLSLWSTWRRACTESGSTGSYGVTVTDAYPVWSILVAGSTAPADFSSQLATISIVDGATQPVTEEGEIVEPIIIGDDYLAANNRAFNFYVEAVTGVTIGTATCFFGLKYKDYTLTVEGTLSEVGSEWLMSFDITRTDTESLVPGHYTWSAEVTAADGTEITRVRNARTVELVRKQT